LYRISRDAAQSGGEGIILFQRAAPLRYPKARRKQVLASRRSSRGRVRAER